MYLTNHSNSTQTITRHIFAQNEILNFLLNLFQESFDYIMVVTSSNVFSVACLLCQSQFGSQSNLDFHIKSQHLGQFLCAKCPSFSSFIKSRLIRHLSLSHDGATLKDNVIIDKPSVAESPSLIKKDLLTSAAVTSKVTPKEKTEIAMETTNSTGSIQTLMKQLPTSVTLTFTKSDEKAQSSLNPPTNNPSTSPTVFSPQVLKLEKEHWSIGPKSSIKSGPMQRLGTSGPRYRHTGTGQSQQTWNKSSPQSIQKRSPHFLPKKVNPASIRGQVTSSILNNGLKQEQLNASQDEDNFRFGCDQCWFAAETRQELVQHEKEKHVEQEVTSAMEEMSVAVDDDSSFNSIHYQEKDSVMDDVSIEESPAAILLQDMKCNDTPAPKINSAEASQDNKTQAESFHDQKEEDMEIKENNDNMETVDNIKHFLDSFKSQSSVNVVDPKSTSLQTAVADDTLAEKEKEKIQSDLTGAEPVDASDFKTAVNEVDSTQSDLPVLQGNTEKETIPAEQVELTVVKPVNPDVTNETAASLNIPSEDKSIDYSAIQESHSKTTMDDISPVDTDKDIQAAAEKGVALMDSIQNEEKCKTTSIENPNPIEKDANKPTALNQKDIEYVTLEMLQSSFQDEMEMWDPLEANNLDNSETYNDF